MTPCGCTHNPEIDRSCRYLAAGPTDSLDRDTHTHTHTHTPRYITYLSFSLFFLFVSLCFIFLFVYLFIRFFLRCHTFPQISRKYNLPPPSISHPYTSRLSLLSFLSPSCLSLSCVRATLARHDDHRRPFSLSLSRLESLKSFDERHRADRSVARAIRVPRRRSRARGRQERVD